MAKMSKAAVLVAPGKFEIREFPIPETGDDEMLIKVEGCGVCGTDGHEYKRDPFNLCPVVLGHEGSGVIVKLGKNIVKDSAGVPVKEGDRIVTCVIPCGHCNACTNTPARTNLCENCGVYGLFPDDDIHLNGYYAEYMVVRPNSTFFNVTGLSLDQRMLIEPAAVAVHAVERAKTTGLLRFNTKVLVQGCGPIGLMVLAVLRTLGIEEIIAVDGNDNRLELAKEMGASKTFNFTKYPKFEDMLAEIRKASDGLGAEFVFQCTGVPAAAANAWKMIRRGGGRIVNIGSIVALGGKACCVDYAAAKGGILAATRSLAIELGRSGINVNCVSPGLVERNPEAIDQAAFAGRYSYLNRICTREDVASTVLYLTLPESSYITGQNFVIDGGRSLGLKGD